MNWTPEEIQIVKSNQHLSHAALAELLGRTSKGVERKRAKLKLPIKTSKIFDKTFEEDARQANARHWETEYNALYAKYKNAIQKVALVDRLVDRVQALAPTSYAPAPAVRSIRKPANSSPQSALLIFSDTHIGKVVHPEQTLGFGGYDFQVFMNRLKYMEESVISILRDHVNTDVPELVIAMLGDMLDGALNKCAEAGLRNTQFSQFYGAGHAIAQMLRNLAAQVPKIRIYTAAGNHTRWSFQHKMPTENRFSNLDFFLYAFLQALTRDIPTIEWNLDEQPFAIFPVQGFTFHASHGDHWRGGDKALGIPNHAIGRQISTTVQLFTKNKIQTPHYYLAGHLHRSITLPHALGEVVINGGFPGLDNYALAENFNPVDPVQRFFLVHPKFGRTATYDLSLKFAGQDPEPYVLPNDFRVE